MRTIYKYPLEGTDEQIVLMPRGAEILCVQVQNGIPCLWADISTENAQEREKRYIRIIGTGHELPKAVMKYIGTFQMGALVFHVFEASPEP